MQTKILKTTGFALAILVWVALVAVGGLGLWKRHGCVIDAGTECTQAMESK